jgi:hypothetical protein
LCAAQLFILSRQYNPRDTGAYREDDGAGRATKFASLHFSTDELPEQQRVEIWQDVFNHSVLHLEIKSLADEAFYSRAEFREFGGVRVGNCTVSAMDMRRKASHIGRETDLIGLYVNLEGTSMLRQLNRELTLNPGEATVILNTEPAALLKSEGRWFGIQLPRTTLSSLGGLEDRAAQLIPGNSTALRLLLSYLSVGQPELEMASPALLNVVSAHVSDLCSLAIGTAFRPQDVASRKAPARRDCRPSRPISPPISASLTIASPASHPATASRGARSKCCSRAPARRSQNIFAPNVLRARTRCCATRIIRGGRSLTSPLRRASVTSHTLIGRTAGATAQRRPKFVPRVG